MPRNISQDISGIVRNLASLTPTNRLLLAYQFERAKKDNRDGFTMDAFGNLYQKKEGYAVAMTRDSFESLADALDTMDHMQQYGFSNVHLGYWRDDQDDGKEYVDVSMVTTSLALAQALGQRLAQKAVWDFSTDSAIRLDMGE